MLTATSLPPALLPNDATVFPESMLTGQVVHADPACPWREMPTLYRCSAIQAAVWLQPRWCPRCIRYTGSHQ